MNPVCIVMKISFDDCEICGPCESAREGRFGASPVLGKGGGNQAAALKEQQKARQQSAKQFAMQMAMMKQQSRAASDYTVPTYTPPSPQSMVSMDTIEAGRDQMRANKKRFGFANTSLAGNTGMLGGMSMLGSQSSLS